jgi:hypothetical protein
MAEIALVAGLASGAASIFGGFSKKKEGDAANDIAMENAGNLRMEGDKAREIALYNSLITKHDGDVAKASAELQAMQLQRAAGEERAVGQIAAKEKRGDMERTLSTQRARAASSGAGGVGTAGVMDIMGDTIERGEYLAGLEMFGGETRARGKLDQATAAQASGEAARRRAIAAAYGIELEGDAARSRAYSAARVQEMQGKAAKKAGNNAMRQSILEGGSKALTAGAGYFGGGTGGYDPKWKNTTVTRYR